MRKAVKAVTAVAGRVCLIGLSIQIVLGLLWMFCNFTGFQKFGDSGLYVEISKNFLCDEYTGILYPVLLLFARGVEDLTAIPYYCALYLVQLTVALYASHAFLQAMHPLPKRVNVWGSLAMLTFPLAMQCHLAVLPESLTGSMLLLEFTGLWKAVRERQMLRGRHLIKVVVFWLAAALLLPEYLYLGAVPVIILFLYGGIRFGRKDFRQLLYNLIIVASFAGIIVGMQDLTQEEGAYGRVHRSVNAALFGRFSWTTIMGTYGMWPEEVKEELDEALIWEVSFYSGNMESILETCMEEQFGVERAEELFGEIARLSYANGRERILHEIVWDAAGYGFAPVISRLLLSNRGYESYTLRNYELMRNRTPVLTKYYFQYGNWWFAVGLLLAGILQLCLWYRAFCDRKISGIRKGDLGRTVLGWGIIIAAGAGMIGWYTMRGAGMFDYKKTIVIGCLWTAWMVLSAGRTVFREET